jgi:hypothetical protein
LYYSTSIIPEKEGRWKGGEAAGPRALKLTKGERGGGLGIGVYLGIGCSGRHRQKEAAGTYEVKTSDATKLTAHRLIPSLFKLWIKTFKLNAGISSGKSPVHFTRFPIAPLVPRCRFLSSSALS